MCQIVVKKRSKKNCLQEGVVRKKLFAERDFSSPPPPPPLQKNNGPSLIFPKATISRMFPVGTNFAFRLSDATLLSEGLVKICINGDLDLVHYFVFSLESCYPKKEGCVITSKQTNKQTSRQGTNTR